MTKTTITNTVITLLLLFNSCSSHANNKEGQLVVKPTPEMTYRNKAYHFSFTIPAGWEKQSGNPNSDNVLFMQFPISSSCSFQFNVTPMSTSFPAEAAVTTSVAAAYHELKLGKLVAAKRRDTLFKEKGKTAILTRGWEITEKNQTQQQQRIIYQAYDRENHYFNFIAAATSEKFAACAPELHKIIDSISFAAL